MIIIIKMLLLKLTIQIEVNYEKINFLHRILKIVQIKLIAPKIEEAPDKM